MRLRYDIHSQKMGAQPRGAGRSPVRVYVYQHGQGLGVAESKKSTQTVRIGSHPPYCPYVGGGVAPLTLPQPPPPRPSSNS